MVGVRFLLTELVGSDSDSYAAPWRGAPRGAVQDEGGFEEPGVSHGAQRARLGVEGGHKLLLLHARLLQLNRDVAGGAQQLGQRVVLGEVGQHGGPRGGVIEAGGEPFARRVEVRRPRFAQDIRGEG